MDLYVAEGKSMDRIVPMKSSSKALRPARTGLRDLAPLALATVVGNTATKTVMMMMMK